MSERPREHLTPPPPELTRARILVVEDDENLRLALVDNLEDEGYDVASAADGGSAQAAWSARTFDLIILDIMLPDIDGYQLCRQLRAQGDQALVLMLTARSLENDLVEGFDAGADDYIAKPYRLRELLARVRALLRRRAGGAIVGDVHRFAGFTLDLDARTLVDPHQRPVDLTRTELDLLTCFVRNRGRALSRDEILDQVWGRDVIVDTRTVDNFVSSLKRKLGWSPDAGFRVQTVRGVGYRMEIDPQA